MSGVRGPRVVRQSVCTQGAWAGAAAAGSRRCGARTTGVVAQPLVARKRLTRNALHAPPLCSRYTCNVCAMVNEVPVEYFCALDASGRRIDESQRPELFGGSVEYVAPAEYMVRGGRVKAWVGCVQGGR